MNWIPITDQLPPVSKPVLFCCDLLNEGFTFVDLGVFMGNWTDSKNAVVMDLPSFISESDGTMVGDWSPCSHWMELPKTPDELASAATAEPSS